MKLKKKLKKGTKVKFKTRRGKRVEFTITHRRPKTAHMRKIGAAGKACIKAGLVGTRKNTACIVNYLKGH